ncbi:calcineurin-like phosphoesterase family protein [Alistipes sp.]|uniref:calcineurin-like phosphoesterase family protein n=1 Tax=Alistipes sp. TaxID=1872444 RepID=UPI0023F16FE5|nr:calcineurin-like phosphoesterase family protein [Alistipes sp.]
MKRVENFSSFFSRKITLFAILSVLLASVACERDNTREIRPPAAETVWITGVQLPVDEVVAAVGETFEVRGQGFGDKDVFQLVVEGGSTEKAYFLPMEAAADKAVVTIPQGLPDGTYAAVVRRAEQEQRLGQLSVRIRNVYVQEELPDIAGMNVKGVVRDKNGNPLSGVAVSDGVEIVTTDEEGRYYFYSDKSLGRVFISLPSGYMPETVMNIPQISRRFMATNLSVEQFDFTLRPVDNDRCVLIASTDYHLARRNNDLEQFRDFVNDVNRFILTEQRPVYVLMMGDLTWDEYWYKNYFTLGDFITEMKDLNTVAFHCIGNHDHDPYYTEDLAATRQWRDLVMPAYYSFNIGKSHFVCLDDIVYVNNGGAVGTIGDKSYHNYVSEDQIAWLKKDLALVEDKAAPLFIMMHAPLAYPNASFGNTYYDEARARELLAGFEGFSEVHVLTGHSHDNRNCQLTDAVMDHNTGAVCACWWWSDVYSGRHICKDGTPGGYAVYELEDRDLTWYYKGTGISRDVQFRTYDMNKLWLDPETYLDDRTITVDGTPVTIRDWFSQQAYGRSFNRLRSDNCVYINCWNWDPEWKIEVVEEGRGSLAVKRLWEYDPLHLITYVIPRLNKGSRPSFTANKMGHLFSVQASDPSSTLHITVTDRFGRVYTETMKRPKNFNVYIE